MRKIAILAGVVAMALTTNAALAAAKVKTQPLTPTLAARMNGKVVAETRHGPANFAARTPGRSMMGFGGKGVADEAGNRLVERDKIADPSRALSAELTRMLIEKSGARLSPTKAFAIGDTPADLAVSGPGAQYVFDVATTEWGFEVQNKQRYGAFYKATVRLVEVSSQRVVMTAACDWKPFGLRTFSDAEIKADGSEGVKSHLSVATEACLTQFKRELFGAE
ncbi:MAG: hypothetical protein JWR84_2294 [Caulobacter sp.]|nr:hypothetical protein [Caulobacter sp.]